MNQKIHGSGATAWNALKQLSEQNKDAEQFSMYECDLILFHKCFNNLYNKSCCKESGQECKTNHGLVGPQLIKASLLAISSHIVWWHWLLGNMRHSGSGWSVGFTGVSCLGTIVLKKFSSVEAHGKKYWNYELCEKFHPGHVRVMV